MYLIPWIVAFLFVLLTPVAIAHYKSAPAIEPKSEPETGEEVKFRCRICGREFDPDPRMICDGGLQPYLIEDGEPVPGDALNLDFVRTASNDELRAAGIEPDDREKLLRGEHVGTALCICLECQDEMANDDEEEEFPPNPN